MMPGTARSFRVFDKWKGLRAGWAIALVLMVVAFFGFTWAPSAAAAEKSFSLLAISRTAEGPGPGFVPMELASGGAVETVQVETAPVLTEKHIGEAWVHEQGFIGVLIETTPEGRQLLVELTREQLNRRLAILVEGRLMMAPFIQEIITSGQIMLSGEIDRAGAEKLVAGLQGRQTTASADAESLFPDETILLARIEKDPSPHLYAELAGVRGRHAAGYYERWREFGRSADLRQAIFYAASAAELRPDWDQPRVLLAMIYTNFSGDRETLELATELLIEAVDINPANGPAQLLLVQVLMKQGRFWSAIEQYDSLFAKSAAMITPMNTAPLALCYILDGRIQAGILYFDRLAAMHPANPAVTTGQAVLLKHGGEAERARNILTDLASSAAAGPELRRYAGDLLASWDREEME